MRRSYRPVFALLAVFFILVLWTISTGNALIGKEESVKAAWSQVENAYQRRLDLVPNMVNTVKGYAKHEKETLENVIQARNQAAQATAKTAGGTSDAKGLESYGKAQDALGAALNRLLVVVERYPDLKASQNFRDLQTQLEGTGNRVAVERRRFNEAAQDYNTSLRVFPSSIIAGLRGFQPRAYFEAQSGAATAPKARF